MESRSLLSETERREGVLVVVVVLAALAAALRRSWAWALVRGTRWSPASLATWYGLGEGVEDGDNEGQGTLMLML